MIYTGYRDDEKRAAIGAYAAEHHIGHVVVISGDGCPLSFPNSDQVQYSDVIMYVTFYRLLRKITSQTLVVVNECLRTQNRYDLSYNCIRNFLNLTGHQLIFQQLPLIDTREDFMILFDFDTRSRWKRQAFDAQLIERESVVTVQPLVPQFCWVPVLISESTRQKYGIERERLFRELGNKDPHTLPRNLYLLGGMDKKRYIDTQAMFTPDAHYVARNRRLGRDSVITYDEAGPGHSYIIVELPHRFIDFTDFMQHTGQTEFPVLVADLKVDHWYFNRYVEWSERIRDIYASLSR